MSSKTPHSNQFDEQYAHHPDKERLESLFREIDTLNLLDKSKDKIITYDKTTEVKEAIVVLYYALMDFCEVNPDMGEEIDSAWKLILESIE